MDNHCCNSYSNSFMSNFLHTAKWTERIINKFEKYIHFNPDECRHIAALALSSGMVELWRQNCSNPFSFIAWLLTTDEPRFEYSYLSIEDEQFNQKLSEKIEASNVSQPLKTSLHIAHNLRNYPSDRWNKESINNKIISHNINYLNLQGANLANTDLSGLILPANFNKANLEGANLASANLQGAWFHTKG